MPLPAAMPTLPATTRLPSTPPAATATPRGMRKHRMTSCRRRLMASLVVLGCTSIRTTLMSSVATMVPIKDCLACA